MENGSFIDDFSITTSIYEGFSMAMLNNQMVNDSRTINPPFLRPNSTTFGESSVASTLAKETPSFFKAAAAFS
jgi:hypothetical protein